MIKTFEEYGIVVSICKCNKCGQAWIARVGNAEEIVACSRCKKKNWNKLS